MGKYFVFYAYDCGTLYCRMCSYDCCTAYNTYTNEFMLQSKVLNSTDLHSCQKINGTTQLFESSLSFSPTFFVSLSLFKKAAVMQSNPISLFNQIIYLELQSKLQLIIAIKKIIQIHFICVCLT